MKLFSKKTVSIQELLPSFLPPVVKTQTAADLGDKSEIELDPIDRVCFHVHRYKGRYVFALTASAAIWLVRKQGEQWNQFLDDNDLWDTFYDYSE